MDTSPASNIASYLIIRSGQQRCALPLAQVVEIMRPLPVRPLADCPEFVLGVSLIRGESLPVVDLSMLLTASKPAAPARYVVVRTDSRKVALAVDEVVGIQQISAESLGEAPPLLNQGRSDFVAALGILDRDLLLVLQTGRLVPEDIWPMLAGSEER